MIRTGAPLPAGATSYEQVLQLQSLRTAIFLLTVCHVVLVPQDWTPDANLWRWVTWQQR